MGVNGVTVRVSSDGSTYKEIASKKIPALGKDDKDGIYSHEVEFAPTKARYVQVVIKNANLPAWHGGAGNPAYIFVDEIKIF